MPDTQVPTLNVHISYGHGTMDMWRFDIQSTDMPATMRHTVLKITVTATGVTEVWKHENFTTQMGRIIQVKGFQRAMRALAKMYNVVVEVHASHWNCNARAYGMRGVYGTYIAPPPPPEPTRYEVAMLRDAYAERAARLRGQDTGTKLGYCQDDACSNVAAGMAHDVSGRPMALCKAHTAVDIDKLNQAIDLVRRNGRVFTAEVKSFGLDGALFARAARDGFLALVKDGGMTRWVLAQSPEPAGEAVSEFHVRNKRKSTSRNRRFRKGA